MKRLLLSISFLVLIVALLIPGSAAFAQSNRVTRPASTIPFCYGDSWGSYQACDGLPPQNATKCPSQILTDSKAIGIPGEGQIGSLRLFYSQNDEVSPLGCNAWWVDINITHAGCFTVTDQEMIETGHDSSYEAADVPYQLCKGQHWGGNMVGDWQPGGCYYGAAYVTGSEADTQTGTFCY